MLRRAPLAHAIRLALILPLTTMLACSVDGNGTGAAGGSGGGASTSVSSGSAPSGNGATTTTGSSTSSDGAGGAAPQGAGGGGDGGAGTGGGTGEGGGGDGGAGTGGGGGTGEGGSPPGLGPAPVLLGDAGNYVILAKAAITNVPTSAVTGDMGLSPAAASYITEFSMTRVGAYWTSAQVDGFIFAANNDAPTPDVLTTAVGAMEAAYVDAAGRSQPDFLDIGQGGAIGGLTLEPGLYRWNSTVTIPDDLVFEGAANDVWILQVVGDLTMSEAKRITLQGDAKARNIFWQVTGDVVVGTNAHAEGIVMSAKAITLQTDSSIDGRLLAQTAVNIAKSTVVEPAE